MKIFKIRAVAEDINDPLLDCYDPNELSKLFAAHTPPTKKAKPMSLHPEYTTAPRAQKRAVSGIGAGSPERLIGVLQTLGLCPHEMATSLKSLAARNMPLAEYYQVSVYDLDRALADVDCTISQRMELKASLSRANLLVVPR